ncbi:hypothetical protein CEXT_58851 [Caerostris extrusa]|uniref:Uncharacterized protein n=1 Tax=Caerostris extrusa TaxID=172846 RepID=A0AAV4QVP5_CAEEX|nr:hypothetical protein CEXT_58851 [Caerostris extrusa]
MLKGQRKTLQYFDQHVSVTTGGSETGIICPPLQKLQSVSFPKLHADSATSVDFLLELSKSASEEILLQIVLRRKKTFLKTDHIWEIT